MGRHERWLHGAVDFHVGDGRVRVAQEARFVNDRRGQGRAAHPAKVAGAHLDPRAVAQRERLGNRPGDLGSGERTRGQEPLAVVEDDPRLSLVDGGDQHHGRLARCQPVLPEGRRVHAEQGRDDRLAGAPAAECEGFARRLRRRLGSPRRLPEEGEAGGTEGAALEGSHERPPRRPGRSPERAAEKLGAGRRGPRVSRGGLLGGFGRLCRSLVAFTDTGGFGRFQRFRRPAVALADDREGGALPQVHQRGLGEQPRVDGVE